MAAHHTRDRAVIQQQLVFAQQTLQKLRALSDIKPEAAKPNCGYLTPNSNFERDFVTPTNLSTHNGTPPRLSSSTNYFDEFECNDYSEIRIGTVNNANSAREILVRKLGIEVTKLEDDLKVSLLNYLEEVETQKDDLIRSFCEMQQQLLHHRNSCQDQHKQAVEKEIVIQKLRASKDALQKENLRLKQEAKRYNSYSSLPFSEESYPENTSSLSSSPRSFHSHLQEGTNDKQGDLVLENARLREYLHNCDNSEMLRLEHKVEQHEKLSDSYTKELSSKQSLIKKLKAENRGLQTDVQSLENEMLRVNASRLNAEKEKDQLRQELQFSDEQINTLRQKLKTTSDEKQCLKDVMNETKERATVLEENLALLEIELRDLRNSGESPRNKLKEQEICIRSLKENSIDLGRTCDSLRKELSMAKIEVNSLGTDRDRLQREITDKEIAFMNSQTNERAYEKQLQEVKSNLQLREIKLANLESKIQQYERKEAKLNQDVLANVAKYTQAEKELFLLKKEQAQLRGLYDSSENRRNRLRADLEGAREQVRVLENQLYSGRKTLSNEASRELEQDLLRKENQNQVDEIENLHGVISSFKGNFEQLEMDLNSARDQAGVQKMRADNFETLLKKKEEKIKQLQDELVEVHNQNDALTDQLLKRNRGIEILKDSNILLQHEIQNIKASDSAPVQVVYKQVEPANSDSGMFETDCNDREKHGEKMEYKQTQTNKIIQELQAENMLLKEKERKAIDTLNVVEKKLEEMGKENEHLKNKDVRNTKQQSLQDELVEIIPDFQQNGFGELQATPEFDSFMEEDFTPRQASSRLDLDNEELKAQNEALNQSTRELEERLRQESENLNELLSQREQLLDELKKAKNEAKEFSKSFTEADDEKRRLQNKTEQLQSEITDLKETIESREANLWKIQEDRERISEELAKSKEISSKLEQMKLNEQSKSKELEENLMNEMLTKEQELVSLQHQLQSMSNKCKSLEQSLQDTKDKRDTDTKKELSEMKGRCAKLENEVEYFYKKEIEYNQILGAAEENIRTLTVEVQNTTAQEEEAKFKLQELRQDFSLAESEIQKLSQKIMVMKKDAERDQEKKEEYETLITNLENEQQQLTGKLQEAEGRIKDLEKLCDDVQGRKEIAVETMRESLQKKDKTIADITSKLALCENKYADLKNMMDRTEEESSETHKELLELNEKLAELRHEKYDLSQKEKTFRQELSEKELQMAEVKHRADELVTLMQKRDDECNDAYQKIKELEIVNKELKKENDINKELKKENDMFMQAAQDSVSDLEVAFEKSQEEKMEVKRKLELADERLDDLVSKNNQLLQEIKKYEEKKAQQELDFSIIEKSLLAQNDRVDELQRELTNAENNLSLLEEAKEMNQSQEKLLQEKALNALQLLNEMEIEHARLKSQQCEIEKTLVKEKQKQNDLEESNNSLKKINKDLSRELDIERESVWATQDELESKQKELKRTQKELQRHKIELEEAEKIQIQEMNKKSKLKEEILQANRQIEELEVEKETRQRDNEQLEKQVNAARDKIASLENNIEEMSTESADLKGQYDEMKKRYKSSINEISDLKIMLQQQKELCEDYRKTLAERDETILNLNFSRDAADGALQSVKSDLVQKESACKSKNDQISRLQYELNRTQKKLEKTDVFYERKCLENEKLQKEVLDLKRKIVELEEMRVERELLSGQLENYKRLYSMQAAMPARSAQEKVRDWDDKLERAQTRVTDALSELSKDIRRQEQNTFRANGTPNARSKNNFIFDDTEESNNLKTKSYDRANSFESVVSESDSSDLFEGFQQTGKTTHKQEGNKLSKETNRNEERVGASEVGKQENDEQVASRKYENKRHDTATNSSNSKSLLSAPASFADQQEVSSNYANDNDVAVAPPPGFQTTSNQPNTNDSNPERKTLPSKFSGTRNEEHELKPSENVELSSQSFDKYFLPPVDSDVSDQRECTESPQHSELPRDFMPTELPDTNSFSYDVTNPDPNVSDLKKEKRSDLSYALPEKDLLQKIVLEKTDYKNVEEEEQTGKNQNDPNEKHENNETCSEESEDIDSSVDQKENIPHSFHQYGGPEEPNSKHEVETIVKPQKGEVIISFDKEKLKPEENIIPLEAVKTGNASQKTPIISVPTNKTLQSPESQRQIHVIEQIEKTTKDAGKLTSKPNETNRRLLNSPSYEETVDTEKETGTEKDLEKAVEDGEHCRKPSEFLKQLEKQLNNKEKTETNRPRLPPKPAKRQESLTISLENQKIEANLQEKQHPKKTEQIFVETDQVSKRVPRPKPRIKSATEKEKSSTDSPETSTKPNKHANEQTNSQYRPVEIEIEKPVKERSSDEIYGKKPSLIVKEIEDRAHSPVPEPRSQKQESIKTAQAVSNTGSETPHTLTQQRSITSEDGDEEHLDKGRKRVLKLISAFEGKEV